MIEKLLVFIALCVYQVNINNMLSEKEKHEMVLKLFDVGWVEQSAVQIIDCFGYIIEQKVKEKLEEVDKQIKDKLLKKARDTDYADRTEYDESYEIVHRIINKHKGE